MVLVVVTSTDRFKQSLDLFNLAHVVDGGEVSSPSDACGFGTLEGLWSVKCLVEVSRLAIGSRTHFFLARTIVKTYPAIVALMCIRAR